APEAELSASIAEVASRLNASNLPLIDKRNGQKALAELQAKQKALEKSQKQSAGAGVDAAAVAAKLLAEAEALGPGNLIVGEVPGASDEQLRSAMDSLKKKSPSHGILLGAASDGNVSFVAAVSDDLIAKGLRAGDWVREA